MSNVFIDPYVFACPQPEEGLEEFQAYISNIIRWRELRNSGWPNIYISSNTLEVLTETNSYPLWDSLAKSINVLQVEGIQARDVIELVNGLLTKLPNIEDTFSVGEILFDQVACNPSYHLAERPSTFIEQYERLALFLCFISQLHQDDIKNHTIITCKLREDYIDSDVTGQIVDYDYCGNLVAPNCPVSISGQFPICGTPHGLFLSVDPVTIWENANAAQSYQIAIRIYAYKIAHEMGLQERLNEASWEFNAYFFDSAKSLGFMHEPKKINNLLKACAETILNLNLKDTHHLREGKGANDPQVTRGKDRAWRRDIDYDYHLHYWVTENGSEFANVVIHRQMDIVS